MGTSAMIYRNQKSGLTEAELVKEFLEIISPLGFDTEVESDNGIYMNPSGNHHKAVRVWVDQNDNPDDPDYSINGEKYYEVVFFDFIWDADRHGIESMNSDMILAITAEYMKKYPDAIFYCEANLLDKTDIDTLMLQPFQPDWFRFFKSHKFCHGYESRNGWIFA